MNRTRTRTAAAVAAVLIAGAGTASALAATGPASASTSTSSTFTVRVSGGSEKQIDLGTSGFSAGDQDLFTGSITHGGTRIGHLVGQCTTVRVAKTADQLCEFVLRLGAGQIVALGSVISSQNGPGTFALAITGGTGRYNGAAGQIKVTATDGSFPITVELR